MELPARDVKFLNERQLDWQLVPDPQGAACLLIKSFDVSAGGFAPATTELMIRILPSPRSCSRYPWPPEP